MNQHTFTGWGSVPYWNAFVANLEMHGKGRFFDPRLNDATKFPIAAANGFADLAHIDPEEDRITGKLPALHFYQLAIPAPVPKAGRDFDQGPVIRRGSYLRGQVRLHRRCPRQPVALQHECSLSDQLFGCQPDATKTNAGMPFIRICYKIKGTIGPELRPSGNGASTPGEV